MKFIYACDVHGDVDKYDKLFEIAVRQKLKYIVLGGDIWPKHDKSNRFAMQREFIHGYFDKYFSRLEEQEISCVLIPGNDDIEVLDEEFNEMLKKHKNVYNVDNSKVDIEDVCFIGMSKVLDHPFGHKNRILVEDDTPMQDQLCETVLLADHETKLTVSEWEKYRLESVKHMKDALNELPIPTDSQKAIYILHDPPYGVGLDVCLSGIFVGSKELAEFIKESGAYMSLHGHIHESPLVSNKSYAMIGKTVCVQPGQYEYASRKMSYVLIDTINNEILPCFCEL